TPEIPVPPAEPGPYGPPQTPEPPTAPEAPVPPAAPASSVAPSQPYGQQPYGQPAYGQQLQPQQAYPQAPYGSQQYYATAPSRPQGMSITALICGLIGAFLSLFSFGFLPALAGVIFGHIAQKREPYAKPLWLTGIISGYVGL